MERYAHFLTQNNFSEVYLDDIPRLTAWLKETLRKLGQDDRSFWEEIGKGIAYLGLKKKLADLLTVEEQSSFFTTLQELLDAKGEELYVEKSLALEVILAPYDETCKTFGQDTLNQYLADVCTEIEELTKSEKEDLYRFAGYHLRCYIFNHCEDVYGRLSSITDNINYLRSRGEL